MRYLIAVAALTGLTPSFALGQVDWFEFSDPISTELCGLVNAFNSELVVRVDTSKLMKVSGRDLILSETRVDSLGFVTFGGDPAGVLEFAEDGDGFRTLWWLTLDGQVVEIDPFTAEPRPSGQFPEELRETLCDACGLVDAPLAGNCGDLVDPGEVLAPIILEFCGVGGNAALGMTLMGLVGLHFVRRGS